MSKYLCLSQRSTRTISIYAYGIVGGCMSPKDRAIIVGMVNAITAMVYATWRGMATWSYAAYWRLWGECATMRREVEQRRFMLMTRTLPLGLTGPVVGPSVATLDYNPESVNPTETNPPALTESRLATESESADEQKHKTTEWCLSVLDYCETWGTEAYLASIGIHLPQLPLEPTVSERTQKTLDGLTYYHRTKQGKNVRYVECDRLCGETLYLKKGRRYVVVNG